MHHQSRARLLAARIQHGRVFGRQPSPSLRTARRADCVARAPPRIQHLREIQAPIECAPMHSLCMCSAAARLHFFAAATTPSTASPPAAGRVSEEAATVHLKSATPSTCRARPPTARQTLTIADPRSPGSPGTDLAVDLLRLTASVPFTSTSACLAIACRPAPT